VRRFIASANSKRRIVVRFVPPVRKECATLHPTRYFSGSSSLTHNRVNTLSTAFFICFISALGMLEYFSLPAPWAVDSSMYVFNWAVAESVSNLALRCLGQIWIKEPPFHSVISTIESGFVYLTAEGCGTQDD
jgi:hypothetical protein